MYIVPRTLYEYIVALAASPTMYSYLVLVPFCTLYLVCNMYYGPCTVYYVRAYMCPLDYYYYVRACTAMNLCTQCVRARPPQS